MSAALCLSTTAQTRAGSSSSKTPAGAAYTLADGSTISKTNEALTTSTSDYNVVQVTKGTLTLTDCTVTKTGDYSSSYSGDDTSFYGTNSAVYASGTGAEINMEGGIVSTNAKGANAVFATNRATINVADITINTTTGIEKVQNSKLKVQSECYTLDGRRADAFTKGIFIQNGKKVVIK